MLVLPETESEKLIAPEMVFKFIPRNGGHCSGYLMDLFRCQQIASLMYSFINTFHSNSFYFYSILLHISMFFYLSLKSNVFADDLEHCQLSRQDKSFVHIHFFPIF